jgi:hypothetical protein
MMIRTSFARSILCVALLAGAAGIMATPASAQIRRVAAGNLECHAGASVSFVIGSRRTLECTFRSRRGYRAHYEGTMSRWGVDLGVTTRSVLLWGVLAPTANPAPGALAGNYVGASAAAAWGLGVGANALVGGSGNTIALQPVSVEGKTGVNLAVGIGDLRLRAR